MIIRCLKMQFDFFLSIFLFVFIYFVILLIAKKIGWKKKKVVENCSNACPKCNQSLNRIPRKKVDHIIINLTFRIFEFKRYKCSSSENDWEGLRW